MYAFKRPALWIFYGLLAYMPLHIFLSTWLGTSFGVLEFAKVAKDIVLVVGFLFAFCSSLWQPWLKELIKDKLLWLIAAYGALTVLLALLKPTDQDAEILGVVYNLRFLLFFVYGLLLTRLFDASRLIMVASRIVLTVGALVVTFGLLQYLVLPDDILTQVGYARENGVFPAFFIDAKPDFERIMSTLRDPNSLGSYLIIIAPLAAAFLLKQRDKQKKIALAALLIGSVLGVWFTFGRGAWIGFAVALASFVALGDSRFKAALAKHKKPLLIASACVVVVALGGLFVFRDSYVVQNVVLHADESTVLEDPNELRVRFFRESLENVVSNPIGSGPGTAGLASIRNDIQGVQLNENYYLQVASEVGILGLALFLAILTVVALRIYRVHKNNPLATALLASFIGLAITNLLVHIWSNEAVAYTWWGLAAIVMMGNTHNRDGKE